MNAVIYARYSPGPRQTDQSIEGQVRDCMAYAKENNITVLKVYADKHISGSDFTHRAEFNHMIADSEKRQFEAVIVWKIDRFGRDREEIALNKIRLKRNGVRILYAKESIPDGPEGIILESLMEGLAEYYIEDLRQKVKRGQRESALKGKAVSGQAPYGYYIDEDKHYQEKKEESWVVRYVFEHSSAGETATDILAQLQQLGVKNRKGESITKNGIYTMLRNRKYIGECTYDGIPIPIPALIDQKLWDSVHARMKHRPRKPAAFKAPERYLLSCRIFCGECGSLMVGESGRGKSGKIYHYYKCAAQKRKGGSDCTLKTYRKNDLENYVIRCTVQDVLRDDVIDYIADEVVAISKKSDQEQRLASYQASLRDAQKSLKNVMAAIENGILTPSTKDRLMELENQVEEYKTLIAKEKIRKTTITKDQVVYWLNLFRSGDLADEGFRLRLLDVFVHSVYIYNDKVVIAYNYSDDDHSEPLDPDVFRCSNIHHRVRDRVPYSNFLFFPHAFVYVSYGKIPSA